MACAGLAAAYLVAALVPAPLKLPAEPTDTEYVPRPEWYFLWLFQFGKYVEAVPWCSMIHGQHREIMDSPGAEKSRRRPVAVSAARYHG